MKDDSYFISPIVTALNQPDWRTRLERALRWIVEEGKTKRSSQGFRQFLVFWAATTADPSRGVKVEPLVQGRSLPNSADSIVELERELAAIRGLEGLFRHIAQESGRDGAGLLEVELVLDGYPDGPRRRHVSPSSRSCVFGNLKAGNYQLALGTGRVLWRGRLAQADVVWESAPPESPLQLAAGGGDEVAQPSKELSLLDGEVLVEIYPGQEYGQMEATLCIQLP